MTASPLVTFAAWVSWERDLNWQSGPQTGIAFHMISALAVAGRVGLTAVGDDPAQAEQLHARARRMLDEESGRE